MSKKRRILIVEDEMILALMIEKMVVKMGHEVVSKVTSGERAIEVAEKCNPDLILMDIRLDGNIDGIDAIKTIHKNHSIPVIFITGNSDEVYKKRISEIKYLDFLIKPVSYHDLTHSMEKAS